MIGMRTAQETTDTTWKLIKPSMGSPPFEEGIFILSYQMDRNQYQVVNDRKLLLQIITLYNLGKIGLCNLLEKRARQNNNL